MGELRNETSATVIATGVERAANAWTRGVGLLPKATLGPNEGLWIDRCSAVHTMGMRVAIDLYFLDREGVVVKIAPAVPPWRLAVTCARASAVLEMGVGERSIALGDRLRLA